MLGACTFGEPAEQAASPVAATPNMLAATAAQSCPEGTVFLRAQTIAISATPVMADDERDWTGAMNGARVAGIWHLTSPEPNFGGLSGLAVLPSGNLLAVADQGAFVEINLTDGVPSGTGSIGYMRGDDGQPLGGKDTSDSEGLHLQDGIALVSFERAHRISAFHIEGCGMAAREVTLVAPVTDRNDNQGMEALTLRGQTLVAGWEKTSHGAATLEQYDTVSGADIGHLELRAPPGLNLTGLDQLGTQSFAVFRSYAPLTGNKIEVREYASLTDVGQTRVRFQNPLPVDNYEGIAATLLDDGTVRLYLIADNNYSNRQRTLLMALDLTGASD